MISGCESQRLEWHFGLFLGVIIQNKKGSYHPEATAVFFVAMKLFISLESNFLKLSRVRAKNRQGRCYWVSAIFDGGNVK